MICGAVLNVVYSGLIHSFPLKGGIHLNLLE